MKAAAAAFFELPPEEKKMYSMASNDLQGYGQAYVVSEQQKLDWSDILFLMTLPIKDRKLNYWPTRVTDFMYVSSTPRNKYRKPYDALTLKYMLWKQLGHINCFKNEQIYCWRYLSILLS